jgi:hypothetical protein
LYMSIINTFSPGGVVLLRGLSCPLSGWSSITFAIFISFLKNVLGLLASGLYH